MLLLHTPFLKALPFAVLAAALLLVIVVPVPLQAAPNQQINYQGKLTDDTGVTVADGDYGMEFKLYTVPTGGSAIWTETSTSTVTNGLFSVMLGSSTSLANVDFNQTLYLGVNISGDGEMTPRKVIGTVPAAFEARRLDGIASSSFLRSDEADTASGLLTFTGGLISNSSSTITDLTTITATTTNLVVNGERFTDLTGTGLELFSNSLRVATTTLGLGDGTFLGLTDTWSSYTANRVPFTNSAGNALTDSAELTFDGDRLQVVPNGGQNDGIVAANAFIGHHSAGSTYAVFAHKDAQNNTDYALKHSLAGQTNLNAADGQYGGIFFSINGANQAILDVNGNFGIGTTSPASALDVWGDLRVGTSSLATLFTDSARNRVGIGVTTPSSKLHVEGGNVLVQDSTPHYLLSSEGGENNYFIAANISDVVDGGLRIGEGVDVVSGTTRLAIGPNGNVGIGGVFPGSKLSVSGNGSFGTSYDATAAPTNGLIVEGHVGIGTTTPSHLLTVAGNTYIQGLDFTSATGTELTLGTSTSRGLLTVDGDLFVGTSSLPALFADTSTGRVGIGTSTAAALLHVAGDSLFEGTINTANNWISGDGDSEGLFIDDHGNVAVNTSLPGSDLYIGVDSSAQRVDEYIPHYGSGYNLIAGGSVAVAQSFYADVDTITKFGSWLRFEDASHEIKLAIVPDDGAGNPDESSPLYEKIIPNPETSSVLQFYSFSDLSISVTQGTKYWVMIDAFSAPNAPSGVAFSSSVSRTDTGETAVYTFDGGSSWSDRSGAMPLFVEGTVSTSKTERGLVVTSPGTSYDPDSAGYLAEIVSTADDIGYFGVSNDSAGDIFSIATSANVGIGTSSPRSKLTVNGNVLLEGSNRYINFGTTTSSAGYGLRDNGGTMQYRNSNGSWSALGGQWQSVAATGTPYDLSEAEFSTSIDSQAAASVNGLAWNDNGTKLYEVVSGFASGGDDYIYEYDVSTPYDISTASVSQSIVTQDEKPQGITWNNDGSKLYEVDLGTDLIYEYDVSTPYDISSASFSQSTSTQDSGPSGIAWNNDGSKLYEVGSGDDKIYEYDVSTPYDISTASFSQSISTQDSIPSGIAWNNDGTKLYEVGYNSNLIYQYDVSTPYDISSASYAPDRDFDVSAQDASPEGIAFNSGGTKLYMVGSWHDKIYEYNVSAPTRISPLTTTNRVGIGTSTAAALLHVAGDSLFEGTINTANNWISGDGDSEGLFIDDHGNVAVNTSLPGSDLYIGVDSSAQRVDEYLNGSSFFSGSFDVAAQSFYADVDTINKFGAWVRFDDASHEIKLAIVPDDGAGNPDESSPLYEKIIPDPRVSSEPRLYSFSNLDISVTQGTKYWVMIDGFSAPNAPGGLTVGTVGGRTDTDETGDYSFDSGSSWNSTSNALALFVEGTVSTSKTERGLVVTSPGTSYDPDSAGYLAEIVSTADDIGYFGVSNDSAGDIFSIATSANVGIGTSSPRSKLTVIGNGTTTDVAFSVHDSTGSSTLTLLDNGNLQLGTTTSRALLTVDGDFFVGTSSLPALFSDTSTGRVGIGTTSPSSALTVAGGVRFSAFGAGTLQTDSAGNVSVSSDERLKVVGDPFQTGIDALRGIAPINYKWNERSGLETNGTYVGFSAQNVQQFIPEAVGTDRSGMLTLTDRPILATVINATNEQQAVFDALLGIGTTTPTSTTGLLADAQPDSLWDKIVDFFDGFVDGVLTITGIKTDTLCVGEVCVTEEEFRGVFGEGSQPAPTIESEGNTSGTSGETATITPDKTATGTSTNSTTTTDSTSPQAEPSQVPAASDMDDATEPSLVDVNNDAPSQSATTSATTTPSSEPDATPDEIATSTAEGSAAETPEEAVTSTEPTSPQSDTDTDPPAPTTDNATEPSPIDANDDVRQQSDDRKVSTTTADAM